MNNQTYLELLAADDSNSEIVLPRWMGVDVLTKNQITRWALKSDSLRADAAILKKHNRHMGAISKGSRSLDKGEVLEWELLMPLATPEVELVPFLLDWSDTLKHPSELLPNMGCELVQWYGTHPNPKSVSAIIDALGYSLPIEQSKEVSLSAVIKSPKGLVKI